ncbi:hypothetical protein QVD17_29071 [Tagetes erecta]|uniref:Uncharacterized protein n=1 Tax=Tagetes erecta TaxID=13708 RepID=A0AAD8NKX0_TARER|nr:hypothetical protein QVD17_29071 [Tagetes erecta]
MTFFLLVIISTSKLKVKEKHAEFLLTRVKTRILYKLSHLTFVPNSNPNRTLTPVRRTLPPSQTCSTTPANTIAATSDHRSNTTANYIIY